MAQGRVTAVKIDVEGVELDVLAGGRHFFRTIRPIVLIESFEDSDKVESFFHSLGYEKIDLHEDSNYLYLPRVAE